MRSRTEIQNSLPSVPSRPVESSQTDLDALRNFAYRALLIWYYGQ
jgi:hypothetical protein